MSFEESAVRPVGARRRLIGDIAVALGFASREEIEDAVAEARLRGVPTGQVLLDRKVLRADELAQVLAERFEVPYVDLSTLEPDMGAVSLLTPEAVRRYEALPIGFEKDGCLLLAMADPANVLTIDDVTMITGRRVKVLAAASDDIVQLASRLHQLGEAIEDIGEEELESEQEVALGGVDSEAPIVKLVHSLIAQAVAQGASDIHISPGEGETAVQLRVDGVLHRCATVRKRMTAGVISRIKIMGELDISERRVPQDGRFALTVNGSRVDIRVVTLPLIYGEGAVLRILNGSSEVSDLSSLGMGEREMALFSSAIERPNGAVLVTGPTGSGKSTTLYAALSALSGGERSVLSIEDPVEVRLKGVRQIQVSTKVGVTFATGLRSMLRADPDVIMVGEIRDRETATIAVEAALTGHLLLSTLHTRDAPGALGRLIDMGIEPFLVAGAVDCVLAQRLVRLLCPHCKHATKLPDALLNRLGVVRSEAFDPAGCPRCNGTGYRGRIGVYEVMALSEEMRSALMEKRRLTEIRAIAEKEGMSRLRDDGLEKVRRGLTSIVEIERMTASVL